MLRLTNIHVYAAKIYKYHYANINWMPVCTHVNFYNKILQGYLQCCRKSPQNKYVWRIYYWKVFCFFFVTNIFAVLSYFFTCSIINSKHKSDIELLLVQFVLFWLIPASIYTIVNTSFYVFYFYYGVRYTINITQNFIKATFKRIKQIF